MPRYFLELAYDGTPYRGWQRQPAAPSVQLEVERALGIALQRHQVNAVGCGRTDTGVHASQYFLHFDGPSDRVLDHRFAHSLNCILPSSIGIKRVFSVSDDAHARFSATERGYGYFIHRYKDPFLHDRSYLLHLDLDVEAMNDACRSLIGRQDFSCFQRTGSDQRTPICDLRRAEWTVTPHGYRFTIVADRFVRNMVRAVVGTCIRIGRGQRPPDDMAAVIASKDRGQAGKSAPACGLYLERVVYPFLPPTDR